MVAHTFGFVAHPCGIEAQLEAFVRLRAVLRHGSAACLHLGAGACVGACAGLCACRGRMRRSLHHADMMSVAGTYHKTH